MPPLPPGAYTSITDANSLGINLVKTAFDKAVDFELRSQPLFRNAATEFKRVSDLTNPGSTVTFNLYQYKDVPAVTNLHEYDAAVATVVPGTTTVSVTLDEFGDVVIPTLRLRTFSFADVDEAVAALVAAQLADDVDERVQDKLLAGTNVVYSAAGAPTLTGPTTTLADADGDVFSSAIARYVSTRMRGASALPVGDTGEFLAFIHPDVEHDIRAETAAGGWRTPHEFSAAGNIWNGRIGIYEGLAYVTTPRCFNDRDGAGVDPNDDRVYRSYVLGRQALAEAVAIEPHVTIGPGIDPHNRHRPLGYHGIAGWGVYRQDCLWRVETTSSVSDTALV